MLYIMRHGRTEWNNLHKLQGRTDVPLNEEGREMAREAAELYKDTHFDICYCSPLARARETAEIFLKDRNVPVIFDDRLKEMSFGVYEGEVNCAKIPGSPIRTLFKDPENYSAVEGGESFEELFERTGRFLDEIVEPELKLDKDILIIGHGAMNSSIICRVRKRELKDFWEEGIENCRLIKLK